MLLTQVVPDVHFTAQSSYLDDGLTEEVVRLTFELLLYSGLNIVVLVPHAHFDPIGRVVTLTVEMVLDHHEQNVFDLACINRDTKIIHLQIEALIPYRVEVTVDSLGSFFGLANLHRNIRVAGAGLVLCLQALGA